MCNLNLLCKVSDGSCPCTRPGQSGIIKPVAVPLMNPQEGALVLSLFKLLSDQKQMIKKITEEAALTTEKINKVTTKLGLKSNQVECTSEESTNPDQLLKLLTGQITTFSYSLSLVSDIPSPAFKEKAFSLLLQILDENGNQATLPSSTLFNLLLFTTESPPKALKTSMTGDKVIRGTTEVEGNSSVLFKKIVIKEVSSHFRGGCFYLVVTSKNPCVRPLIVPSFVVKARKLNADGTPRKKVKVEVEVEEGKGIVKGLQGLQGEDADKSGIEA